MDFKYIYDKEQAKERSLWMIFLLYIEIMIFHDKSLYTEHGFVIQSMYIPITAT